MGVFSQNKNITVAIKAVRKASELTRAVQSSLAGAHADKDDRSPVTIADFGAQAVVASVLMAELGDFAMVSEEDGAFLREPDQARMLEQVVSLVREYGIDPHASASQVLSWIDAGKTSDATTGFWTLDPIDGTKGFLRGDQYAIALARIEQGEALEAVLGCPRLDWQEGNSTWEGSLYVAMKGEGAYVMPLEGAGMTRIQVSGREKMSEAKLCESYESSHSAHDRSAALRLAMGIEAEPYRIDSQAKYASVARGDADIYLRLPTKPGYVEKIWDHAAGFLVLCEAGGKVTDLADQVLRFESNGLLKGFQGVVGTNGTYHQRVLEHFSQSQA